MTLVDQTIGSPLLNARGVMVIDLLTAQELRDLQSEARTCFAASVEARDAREQHEWDRGNPDRWLRQAPGGPVLDEFVITDRLTSVLRELTHTNWQALGQRGSYSYYCEPGHFLGMHRDIVTCDLTVIIGVNIEGQPDGGTLLVHPWAVRTPLVEVRTQQQRATKIDLEPGQAAILLGGLIPHELTPVRGAMRRTVSPLCFLPQR